LLETTTRQKALCFSSFAKANKDASVITMDTSENENFIEMKEIDLPSPPVRQSSKETAEVTVCEIIRQCKANNLDTIPIDSEWNRGTRTEPEVLTMGARESRTYILQKSVFPASLKILLESETIKKVAN
jgi:phosphoribosylformylglycinamidine (FGAM) synthase-like enzyme